MESIPVVGRDVVRLQTDQTRLQITMSTFDIVHIILLVVGKHLLQLVVINTNVTEKILLECERLITELA